MLKKIPSPPCQEAKGFIVLKSFSAVPLFFIPEKEYTFPDTGCKNQYPVGITADSPVAPTCSQFSEPLRGQFKHSSVICSHQPQTL